MLFALGFDWLRWITSIGFAALLAAAAIVALDGRSSIGPPGRERWHAPVPASLGLSARGATTVVAGTYLLVLAPLPNFIRDFGDAALFRRWFHGMLEAGVYLAPSPYEAGFLSDSHGEAEIDATLAAARRVLAAIAGR